MCTYVCMRVDVTVSEQVYVLACMHLHQPSRNVHLAPYKGVLGDQ